MEPKSNVSANSTTPAYLIILHRFLSEGVCQFPRLRYPVPSLPSVRLPRSPIAAHTAPALLLPWQPLHFTMGGSRCQCGFFVEKNAFLLTLNNFYPCFMLIFLDIDPMGKYNRFGIVYAGGELPRVYYNPASTEVCVFTPCNQLVMKSVCLAYIPPYAAVICQLNTLGVLRSPLLFLTYYSKQGGVH